MKRLVRCFNDLNVLMKTSEFLTQFKNTSMRQDSDVVCDVCIHNRISLHTHLQFAGGRRAPVSVGVPSGVCPHDPVTSNTTLAASVSIFGVPHIAPARLLSSVLGMH